MGQIGDAPQKFLGRQGRTRILRKPHHGIMIILMMTILLDEVARLRGPCTLAASFGRLAERVLLTVAAFEWQVHSLCRPYRQGIQHVTSSVLGPTGFYVCSKGSPGPDEEMRLNAAALCGLTGLVCFLPLRAGDGAAVTAVAAVKAKRIARRLGKHCMAYAWVVE